MSDSQVSEDYSPAMTDTDANDVIAFLRKNPKFLIEYPEACDLLMPPQSVDGRKVADFQSFMIQRLKDDKADVMNMTAELVENARNNMNNQQRIHKAVLRLLEARNFEEFIQFITMDLSALLDTDISVLVVESNGHDIRIFIHPAFGFCPKAQLISGWANSLSCCKVRFPGLRRSMAGAQTLCSLKLYCA